MTVTSRAMEWLNENRHRAYPMREREWREKAPASSGLDCVLLDALVFDGASSGTETLSLKSVTVASDRTEVWFKYGGVEFSVTLDGDGSYQMKRGSVLNGDGHFATVSLAFSGHAYILSEIGQGTWSLECPILTSRVVNLSDGLGVDSISVGGSSGVEGHAEPADVSGDVVLEDGYRTSPVVHRGMVLVRVGQRYGINPCGYDFGRDGRSACRDPLFFFCGQNAVNGGNVNLVGGSGITVSQGRNYMVRSGSCKGREVPCIEITASQEVADMCAAGTGAQMV